MKKILYLIAILTLIDTAVAQQSAFSTGGPKVLIFNNSLTFSGTDGTTMTFPGASDTVAGLGTVQTWTAAQTFGVLNTTSALISQGTKFTASGCANSTTVGGATAGKFTSGTTGTCTVTITLPTAPNGWACHADDLTTPANFIGQSASATGSCTIQGSTISGDIIVFSAQGF